MLYSSIKNSLVVIPRSGGTYSEGIVGVPRFINPTLSFTDIDKDISYLVFAGLFKKDEAGLLTPLLAENYTLSEDGLTYTVTLKKDIVFHNGEQMTSADVLFTIKKIQDPNTKSPKETAWKGVTVTAVDDYTVEFKLKQRFADFLEMLTIGILSEKEWSSITPEEFSLSDKNLNAVGAGPYEIQKVSTNKDGIPESITLKRFKKYILGKPYIKNLVIKSYNNEKSALAALTNKEIDALGGISAENINLLPKNTRIQKTELPRIFGLFLNKTKQPLFRDKALVSAINESIDKKVLVDTVLYGHGVPLENIIPFVKETETMPSFNISKATEIMEKAGYTKNDAGLWTKDKKVIAFIITTSDIDELKDTAEFLRKSLREFGIDVTVETYDPGSFSQNILNPRNYDSLVFGQVVNTPSNLFAFWHSSEKTAPGLNISMYTNANVDSSLEKLRKETDSTEKEKLLTKISNDIQEDQPAIALFKPVYIYASRKEVFNQKNTNNTTHRFIGIEQWALKKDHVWSIFNKK